jgi:thiamine pyrophosphate-dependent acetolactate synthase large subunit-like protein
VLARKLGLPVVSTFFGRGLMEQSPDVFFGTYLAAAGDPAIAKMIDGADALLLLASFSLTPTSRCHIGGSTRGGPSLPSTGRLALAITSILIYRSTI